MSFLKEFLFKKFSFIIISILFSFASTTIQAQMLEEIIVTAQKREQNLQDVPLAVSAFTGDFLNENAIKDVYDLQLSAPSLIISGNQSSSTGNFTIRGVGTGAQNFGLESSVGLYVDGVYRSRQSSMINELVDIEAVEVLRGPQGTLFGKNSSSGAVLLRTVAPSHEQNGFMQLSFGDYNLQTLSGAFNASLSDNVASRTTYFGTARDGWGKVTNQQGEFVSDRGRSGIRQQFLYTPTDSLSVRTILDHSSIEENCCAVVGLVDSLKAQNRTAAGGAAIPGTDAIVKALGGLVFETGTASNLEMGFDQLPKSIAIDRGISIEVINEMDYHTFTSLSGYREFTTNDTFDVDFTSANIANRTYGAKQSSFAQEFRLASNRDDGFNYILGAYFSDQTFNSEDYLSQGTGIGPYTKGVSPDVLGALIAGVSPGVLGFANAAYSLSLPTSLAAHMVPGNVIQDFAYQDHRNHAIFAKIDLDLSDEITFNFGIRNTTEHKSMISEFSETMYTPHKSMVNIDAIKAAAGILGAQAIKAAGGMAGAATNPATGTYNSVYAAMDPVPYIPALNVLFLPGWANCSVSPRLCPRDMIQTNFDDNKTTGDIGLTFTPNDQTMYYGSFSTGYKAGGTNTDRIDTGFDTSFGAEETETWEVGMKKDFANMRLNIALYDMSVKGLQTNTFTGTAFNLQSAGKVEVNGAEIEMMWLPSDSLTVSLAMAYTDASFKDFAKGNCQIASIFHSGIQPDATDFATDGYCNRSGGRVGGVSKLFSVLNVAKHYNYSDGTNITLGAEFSNYSDMMMHNNNDPLALQQDVALVNLRAMLSTPSGIDYMLWVRNATNTFWHGTVFDAPLQDGKLGTYPREPRTWGINMRKNF
ncbi:MAG: hypothetical protein CBC38_04625 [Gammaproteobacteria bacterium TMED78]|nr:MAG: hypothetical protein CBC38_04625 [Gammaproteobacteria bacterium TMED78]|tara:strand:+ start:24557 stop:27160 length:2604 start_codon:yes stop_codon:yes gene_type:complete